MRALWELQRALPANTMYTCDIGEHLLYAIHYMQSQDPHAFHIMTGLGSMGSSIAGALGSRLGRSDRVAAAICGDGCFAMNQGDLALAAREGIPVVVAVLNDERYGMVEIGHEALYGRRPLYPAGPMDVALMARSVGADWAMASVTPVLAAPSAAHTSRAGCAQRIWPTSRSRRCSLPCTLLASSSTLPVAPRTKTTPITASCTSGQMRSVQVSSSAPPSAAASAAT